MLAQTTLSRGQQIVLTRSDRAMEKAKVTLVSAENATSPSHKLHLRRIRESDHLPIVRVVDAWWGGRHVSHLLPKLFFEHFQDISTVVENDDLELVAFLVGFVSQSKPDVAYIHFVGVNPNYRKEGIAKELYTQFFETVRAKGCTTVKLITSPANKGSIAFHERMGFKALPGDQVVEGIPVILNYDGSGNSRVSFSKEIQ